MLRILPVILLQFIFSAGIAQLGETNLGSTALAKTKIGYATLAIGRDSLPVCSFPGICYPGECVEYTFNGIGSWEDEANWRYGIKPPNIIRTCYVIRVDPPPGSKSVLLSPRLVLNGGKVIVETGKQLIVPGNLIINQ